MRRYNTILAKSRTLMANERTLLSYWRTALSFIAIGLFVIEFFHGWVLYLASAIFLLGGIGIFIFGTVKFKRYKDRIGGS